MPFKFVVGNLYNVADSDLPKTGVTVTGRKSSVTRDRPKKERDRPENFLKGGCRSYIFHAENTFPTPDHPSLPHLAPPRPP